MQRVLDNIQVTSKMNCSEFASTARKRQNILTIDLADVWALQLE